MKIRSINLAPFLGVLGCLSLGPAAGATEDAAASKSPQPQLAEQDVWKRWKLAHDAGPGGGASEGVPSRFDKASGLLGMEVRNQNNELVGHIKDLVIDWHTDQVAYAVIRTAPKATLLTVPLAALAISPDHQHLVLSAEKSKLQAATGSDRNR